MQIPTPDDIDDIFEFMDEIQIAIHAVIKKIDIQNEAIIPAVISATCKYLIVNEYNADALLESLRRCQLVINEAINNRKNIL